jgi:hypothetical protein
MDSPRKHGIMGYGVEIEMEGSDIRIDPMGHRQARLGILMSKAQVRVRKLHGETKYVL